MLALLAVGSKTPSHLHASLERYAELLQQLLGRLPDQVAGQHLLLQHALDFYVALPQKVGGAGRSGAERSGGGGGVIDRAGQGKKWAARVALVQEI